MNNGNKIWSAQQTPIFDEFKSGRRNFLVGARAGTGKTTTIQHGIGLAPEEKKVYLAFNKKNVLEAKEKITDQSCQVMSLNGLGHRFVLQNWKGAKPDDSVEMDRINAACRLVKGASKFSSRGDIPTQVIKQIISFTKNTSPFSSKVDDIIKVIEVRGLCVDQRFEDMGWTPALVGEVVLKAMELAKTFDRQMRITFEDQIWLPIVMGWARPWFDLVVVDECQDMNFTQLTLARRACKSRGRMVLVGDARQCIYGFRGAEVGGMERMKKELNAVEYPLTVTYRCPKMVVDLAKVLVPDYVAHESAPNGSITEVSELTLAQAIKPGDAVLSRTNAPLMQHCLAAIRANIPAYIEGRDIGMTLLAIHDKVKGGCSSVQDYAKKLDSWGGDRIGRLVGDPDSDAFKSAIQTIEDQVMTLCALAEDVSAVSEIEPKLRSIFDDTDKGTRKLSVVFSSVHKAKGMEWGKVFLIRDTFKSCSWTETVSENNNIAYVAVTRAKADLVWVNKGKKV